MALFTKDSETGQPVSSNEKTPPASGMRAVIGSGVRIIGRIEGTDDIAIEGAVEGELDIQSSLRVAAGGRIKGDVAARSIVVYGHIEGDLRAKEMIELHPGSSVDGTMTSPRIAVADGAEFNGSMKMSTTSKNGPQTS